MKDIIFEITSTRQLTQTVFEMKLKGDVSGIKCGQFVNILIDGLYLRRPISVCDLTADELTLVYKVVGKGTQKMSQMGVGTKLDILTELGNGYDLSVSGDKPLLIGGGVGVPPMFLCAKRLIDGGKDVSVVLGFNTKAEVFYEEEFRKLGAKVTVATVDGSCGVKGFVTDAMKDIDYSYFYTCGPEPMLKAVYNASKTEGQFSFEERMGCGFGACMGCSCKTLYGNKRICKDGPVLVKKEIIWEK